MKLPAAVFEIIPSAYPLVLKVLHDVGVKGPELLALSYTKRFKEKTTKGEGVLLAQLADVLVLAGVYPARKPAQDGLINQLSKKDGRKPWLQKATISRPEKKDKFLDYPGQAKIVMLTAAGEEKLDEVNKVVEKLFVECTASISELKGQLLGAGIRRSGRKLQQAITERSRQALFELAARKDSGEDGDTGGDP